MQRGPTSSAIGFTPAEQRVHGRTVKIVPIRDKEDEKAFSRN